MTTIVKFTMEHIVEGLDDALFTQSNVEIHLKESQLGMLVNMLHEKKPIRWRFNLVLERENGQLLNGCLVEQLKQCGVEKIITTLVLDELQPEETIHDLHFLRECSSQYIDLEWTMLSTIPIPLEPLVHLIPPRNVDPRHELFTATWNDMYSLEGLRYRRGPGMIVIRDQRQTGEWQIIHLNEEADLNLFWFTREPKRLEDVIHFVGEEQFLSMNDVQLLIHMDSWVLNLVTPTNRQVIPYM